MSSVVIKLRDDADIAVVQAHLKGCGVWAKELRGEVGATRTTVIALKPYSKHVNTAVLMDIPGVEDVLTASSSHPLVDAQRGRKHWIGETLLGEEGTPILMAGPCSIESEEQIHTAAAMVKRCGATVLRGGAFKPRSSPYSFCGNGAEALGWLKSAASEAELGIVTEVMSEKDVDAVGAIADLIQIGSRNMQNFSLLHAVGGLKKTVLLKRGMSATVDEWLLAGEHLLDGGAAGVIFCERGLRSFDSTSRNLLDLNAVALLKHVYGMRVVVDPSHAAGRRDLILPLAKAAIAVGVDGLLVEAHPQASEAMSDGPQALGEGELKRIGEIF